MLRVGDYVTGVSYLGGTVAGRVTSVSSVSVMVDDGVFRHYCLIGKVTKMETPIPNEDIMLDEFDEGGLKKMPDGTLESVHIPEEGDDSYKTVPLKKTGEVYLISKKKKEEAMIPYTATGTGGPPRPKPPVLEWKVEVRFGAYPSVSVRLYVDGRKFGGQEFSRPKARYLTARQERKLAKKIAEAKENILRLYRLTLKESGRVE